MEARYRTDLEAGADAFASGLFERDHALGLIGAALDAALGGRGSAVALEGGYGSGKSALAAAARELAAERSLRVLAATGREREKDLQLGGALQLFEGSLLAAMEDERIRLLAGPAREALRLFESGPSADPARPALEHALYRLSANLAAESPLLLVVDDADLLDASSARFLLYLVERLEALPLALVLTSGSAVRAVDPDVLEAIASHSSTRRCEVPALTASGTGDALRGSLFPDARPRFCEAVQAATGGLPFLLGELLRALARAGVDPGDAGADRVPAVVSEPIASRALRRARAVSPDAEGLLVAAAVLGRRSELRHAARLAGLARGDAASLADALAAAGLFAAGQRAVLVHPAVEVAVAAAHPPAERAEAQFQAARLLAAEGAAPGSLAGHLLHAVHAGDGWVVETLRRAAHDAIAEGDGGAAAIYLRRALEEPPSAGERARVLLELARAEAMRGDPGAVNLLTEGITQLPYASDRARTALDTGRTLLVAGRFGDAAATFELGLSEREELDPALTGLLRAARAAATRLEGAPARVTNEPAEASGLSDDRAWLAERALAVALGGDSRSLSIELAHRALEGRTLLDEEGADGIAYYMASAALIVCEDLQLAEAALSAALDDAEQSGSLLGQATACCLRSFAVLRRGRLSAAGADAARAAAAQANGWRLALPGALAVLSAAKLDAGDLQGACRQVELAAADRGEGAAGEIAHLAARARLRLAARRAEEALADYLGAGRLLEAAAAPNPSVLPWRGGAARALALTGDRSEALRMAHEELALAERFGAPGAVGRALRTLGALEQGSVAIELLEAAVERLEGSQTALERAHALVDLGTRLRRGRRPREARDPLRRGLDLAQRCGAGELVERAMREAMATGARPRRAALHGVEALTPRELQAAGLAAEGRTNREIADTLFVTVKTVEWHLKHSYGKLGISGRRELRRALAPRGGPDSPETRDPLPEV